MNPIRQVVTGCVDCPYASDGLDNYDDPKWSCHATYTPEGWPTPVPTPSEAHRAPHACPLRGSPRLVVLEAA